MGDKARIPLAEAQALARECADLLADACATVTVAGSIRRERPDVGDIELVCVPITHRGIDLFGGETGKDASNELDVRCVDLLLRGVFDRRLDRNGRGAVGSRYKRLSYKGFALDVFAVLPPASLGCLMAIRTGPRWFSKALVVPKNKQVYDDEGRALCAGLMPAWLEHRDGRYIHIHDGGEWPAPTEESVFELLGLSWIEPRERDAWMAARTAGVGVAS